MGRLGIGVCLAVVVGACGQSARGGEGTAGGSGGSGGSGSSGSAGAGAVSAGAGAGAGAGAVGSGGQGGSAGAGSGSGGSAAQPGGSGGEFFVEGLVNGELVRLDVDARAYWFQGLVEGYLYVDAVSEEVGWGLVVPNYDGVASCGAGTITLMHYEGDSTIYQVSDPFVAYQKGCSLTVTRAAPMVGDVLEGTFSGELTPIPGSPSETTSVTEGAFRVPRIADGLPR